MTIDPSVVLLLVIGGVSGITSGLFGIGGGVLIVPSLASRSIGRRERACSGSSASRFPSDPSKSCPPGPLAPREIRSSDPPSSAATTRIGDLLDAAMPEEELRQSRRHPGPEDLAICMKLMIEVYREG